MKVLSPEIYIPKDKHSKRPLGLPALEDNIVQKGIAWNLEAIYEQNFLDCSYGLYPEKTRAIDLRRGVVQRVKEDKHGPHTFDFLGFTHYGGRSRKGNWVLCRRTSAKKFHKACKSLSAWLRQTRCLAKLPQWWPTLQAKLAGHYQPP